MKRHNLKNQKVIGYSALFVSATLFVTTFASPLSSSVNNGFLGSFFNKNSNFSVEVKAAENRFELTEGDLKINPASNKIWNFSPEGKARLDSFVNEHDEIDLVFPDSLPATAIDSFAFRKKLDYSNKSIRLWLSNNITRIESSAFSYNKSITQVNFGNKTEIIMDSVFANCNLTGELVLPEIIKEIHHGCFEHNNITGKITLPDGLTNIGAQAFAYNQISEVDFGKYDKVNVTANLVPNDFTGSVIPFGLFTSNKIEKLDLPKTITAIGSLAFQDQNIFYEDYDSPDYYDREKKIENLVIPSNVKSIGTQAFFNTPIRKLTIENGVESIGISAFSGSKIEGNLTFPESVKEIGHSAFQKNKLSGVYNLNSNVVERDTFSDNDDTLKNISFNYTSINPNLTTLRAGSFNYGLLRSINIPENIKTFDYVIKNPREYYSDEFRPFEHNPGWYRSNEKVALYRVDSSENYVTDNELSDGEYHVYNPVLFEFDITDTKGNKLPETFLPKSIEINRKIKGGEAVSKTLLIDNEEDKVTTINSTDYKLGDEVSFTLSDTPEGYNLVNGPLSDEITKDGDKYKLTLTTVKNPGESDLVKEVNYAYGSSYKQDEGYDVGYKKVTIKLVYENLKDKKTDEETDKNKEDNKTSDNNAQNNEGNDKSKAEDTLKDKDTQDKNKEGEKENKDKPAKNSETIDKQNESNTNTTPDNTNTNNNPSNNVVVPNTTIPAVNPPINVPYIPENIINSGLIPNVEEPVFTIVNQNGTPLGDAVVDKNEGTYTFIEDDKEPLGIAKINDNNTLEIVKVYEDKAPKGGLPQTGGYNGVSVSALGFALIGLSLILKRK